MGLLGLGTTGSVVGPLTGVGLKMGPEISVGGLIGLWNQRKLDYWALESEMRVYWDTFN